MSGDRKRSLSAGADGLDDKAKRHISDVYSTMSVPGPSYGCVHTPSHLISSLNHSPSQRDDKAGYSRSYRCQSRSSSADLTCCRSSSYRELPGGYDRSTRASSREGFGFPNSVPSYAEQGYPGQYDFYEYPYSQVGDAGRRNDEGNPPMPSHVPPPTKRNRFNLSRYQLDDDEDPFATNTDYSGVSEDVKPNTIKTQQESLIQARRQESEESDSTALGFEETVAVQEGADSSSRDSIMSQRERLRPFRNEHSHLVEIPNQWEGEKNLHEFVAFGNVEAALRPLGLMMARAALVNDSVTSRHHRSSSSGPPGCHSNPSNPLQVQA